MTKRSKDKSEQRIAELERELRLKDERIRELKDEIDASRELVREMEQHLKEGDESLEYFITTFGLVMTDDGNWSNGEAIREYQALVDNHEDLRLRYNKLVGSFNRNIAMVNPVGRPLAASEVQVEQVLKLHRRGISLRGIAEETSLGFPTVRTIVGRHHGTDRTTNHRRRRLGLEPKKKDWRLAAMHGMPKQMNKHFERGQELVKAAKGLR